MTTQAQSWYAWAYGKELVGMADAEIQRHAQTAWNVSDLSQLQDFRAEAARRGIRVA